MAKIKTAQSVIVLSLNFYRSSSIFLLVVTMPATRLSSQQQHRAHTNQPYPSPTRALASRSKLDPIAAAEVIVLSSDEEGVQPSTSKAGPSTRSKRKLSNKPISAGEVLEIFSSSSDEGPTLPKEPAKGSASHRELSRLKRVCLCHCNSISHLKGEIRQTNA